MASGRDIQLTKQVGEYLVCAELCRRGFISTSFAGNVPDFDILAVGKNNITIPIQVKTKKGNSWQFDAAKFLNITFSNDHVQSISGKKTLNNPDLICIFVSLASQGKDEFYIFTMKDFQDVILRNHSYCLKLYGGIRPRNPKSTHVAIHLNNLASFKDNWELLGVK